MAEVVLTPQDVFTGDEPIAKLVEELDELIRNHSDSAYHPSCTNKMGMDKM